MRVFSCLCLFFINSIIQQSYAAGNLNIFFSNTERATLLNSSAPHNITGFVSNSTKNTHLHVNGQETKINKDGSFFYTLFPVIGNNLIVANATEALKETAYTTRSIYQSPQWLPLNSTENTSGILINSMSVLIDQASTTNSVNLLQKGFGLGFALQQKLNTLNLTELDAEPIFEQNGDLAHGSKYFLKGYLKSINTLNPTASATINDDGSMNISGTFGSQAGLKGVTAIIHVEVNLRLFNRIDCPLGIFKIVYSADQLDFTINANVNKAADLPLDINVNNVTINEFNSKLYEEIAYRKMNIFFQPWSLIYPAWYNKWFSWIVDQILNNKTGKILETCSKKVHGEITKILNKLLKEVAPDLTLQITASTDSVDWATNFPDITFNWRLGSLNIDKNLINVTFDTFISTNQNINHDPKPIFQRGQCAKLPTSSATNTPIYTTTSVDLANQIFHMLWWGGLFDIERKIPDITIPKYNNIKISNISLKLAPLLPPILNDCEKESPQVQIGDTIAYISFTAFERVFSVKAFVSATASSHISGNDQEIAVYIGNLIFTSFDITETNNLDFATKYWLDNLFKQYLLPLVQKEVGIVKIFDFDIPEVPLYQIFDWLTDADNLIIGNISIAYDSGYFKAKAYVN